RHEYFDALIAAKQLICNVSSNHAVELVLPKRSVRTTLSWSFRPVPGVNDDFHSPSPSSFSTSGRPVMLIRMLAIAANRAVLPTTRQSTSPNIVAEPITASAA